MDAETELTKATKGYDKIISPYSLGRCLFRKILSTGTDVAGTQRKRLASLPDVGKRLSCLSHHCRG